MVFSSSPVLYPPSSSPPVMPNKRKLFQTFRPRDVSPKRPKILGGFVIDEGSEDEQECSAPIVEALSTNRRPERVLDEVNLNTLARTTSTALAEEKEEKAAQVTRRASLDVPASLLPLSSRLTPKTVELQTSSGTRLKVSNRKKDVQQSYEQLIAQRSATDSGRAKKAYYGIDIHKLIDDAKVQSELDEAAAEYKKQTELAESVETHAQQQAILTNGAAHHQMWTEKYRAKKFTELVGDERTHRSVLRWLKAWDATVFPGSSKAKTQRLQQDQEQHRKILLLTGPPGLGKTTLAHVCARQAGYEVLEINASDDRSRDVVKGRIKDALGTETVKGIQQEGKSRKAGRPVCVIVDEVDGVVTGSSGGGGEGGFMKALIDLVQLDQRNSNGSQPSTAGKKKGDRFRLKRPLILICNDVYAPSLRPLRQSSIAEIVHVRKPSIEKVIARLKNILERESIGCDNDAVRRLCETSWGLGTRKQNSLGGRGAGDGDIRSVLVQGEWMSHKFRALAEGGKRLTRKWVEDNMNKASSSQEGLGRGGVREVVERVFVEGAGLPNLPTAVSADDARLIAESKANPIGVADLRKRSAITALRGMIDTTGDHDRIMTDCFATYPTQVYQDDTLLSKPNAGYEWLYFHDMLSSRIFSGQEWELNPYLSTSACGFHDLFASVDRGTKSWNDEKGQNENSNEEQHPFSGLKADFAAYEAGKANRTVLTEMQAGFSAPILRLFSTVDTIAVELVSTVSRMLAPEVKPVVVGGSGAIASVASVRKESEKNCVQHAVQIMHNLGIDFEKVKIENEGFGAHTNGGYALRMEPPLDSLSTFHLSKSTAPSTFTALKSSTPSTPTNIAPAPVRYAIRQVLSQELYKEKARQAALSRQARASGLSTAALSTHPAATTALGDEDATSSNASSLNAKTIKDLTALAAATATLSSAPGSSTTLNTAIKRDFFGRPITTPTTSDRSNRPSSHDHTRQTSAAGLEITSMKEEVAAGETQNQNQRTWVSFHEGYSNAVRKYISLKDLMEGF